MIPSEVFSPEDVMKNRFSGLIVDDDDSVRAALSARLEAREGHDIHQASSGIECLTKAEELRPDFILLDWMMPEMDGMEVLEQLKAKPETSGIPVFMLTSKAKMKNVENALEAGAEGYFSKPVRIEIIVQKIRTLIGAKVEEILDA